MFKRLQGIGLTDGEAKVYLALLDLGPSTSGPVVKEAGISSSKVYEILQRLQSKGLVSSIVRSRTQVFEALAPHKLLDYISEQERALQEQRTDLREILPMLEGRRTRVKQNDHARVFEGYEGIKSYFTEVFQAMKPGEERLVLGAQKGYADLPEVQVFFGQLAKRFASKKIKTRIIFSTDRKKGTTNTYNQLPHTEVRYLKRATPASIGIQGDRVDVLLWTPEKKVLFAIASKEIAESYRSFFWTLWNLAKP